MRAWSWQRRLAALLGAAGTALLIGIPTGVIATPFYVRMTPVLWWNYPIWATSSVLSGLVLATYVRKPARMPNSGTGRFTFAGLLSAFAVGCPVCNKLVVALLGVTGALNVWAPVQPFLGTLSVLLLFVALVARLRGERVCRVLAMQPSVTNESRGAQ